VDFDTFVRATGISQLCAQTWFAAVSSAMDRFQINTPTREAAFLAQVTYESGGFPVPPSGENFNYSVDGLLSTFGSHIDPGLARTLGRQPNETRVPLARQQRIANVVYANRMGNGPEASNDGWTFRGSGPIQITGRDNYRAAGQSIHVDLEANPDLVRNDVNTSSLTAVWFWVTHHCNELADNHDFDAITKQISPAQVGVKGRHQAWDVASAALGAFATATA
jgi:putative chitinase